MSFSDKPLGRSLGWNVTRSRLIHETKWMKLREDQFTRDGFGSGTYTYLELPGAVFVVPVTLDHRVLLIKSYRFTVDAMGWEVPAGTLADCAGLSPEKIAHKELMEETGATCRALEPLGRFNLSNGKCSDVAHFFLARDAEQIRTAEPESFEHISEIGSFTFKDIARMRQDGEISDGDSMLALLLAENYLRVEPVQPKAGARGQAAE